MNIACIYVLHIYYNIIYIFSLLQARYYIQNPNCCITTKTPRSDYTRRRLEVQMEVAMAQLELAKELQLPVILQATGRGKQGLFKLPKIGGNQTIQVYGKVKPCICLVSSRCQFVHGNLWRIRPWCIQGMHRNDGITCFSWGASARWCRTVGVLPGESFGMEVKK